MENEFIWKEKLEAIQKRHKDFFDNAEVPKYEGLDDILPIQHFFDISSYNGRIELLPRRERKLPDNIEKELIQAFVEVWPEPKQ